MRRARVAPTTVGHRLCRSRRAASHAGFLIEIERDARWMDGWMYERKKEWCRDGLKQLIFSLAGKS